MKLVKRGFDYHFEKRWFIPIFLLFPVMMGGAVLLAVLSGDSLPDLALLANPLAIIVTFVYIFFLGGPLAEEFGWRGYALGHLQKQWNALLSSLILEAMWGACHIPLFFIKGSTQSQTPFWGFMILIVSDTILFTWIYNNTNGSILAALIFHTMFNLSYVMFPASTTTLAGLYLLIINVWWHKQ